MSADCPAASRPLHPQTRLIHAGTQRSAHGETSEALFLTQGFVYDTAEAAEARFDGSDPGFIYARFSNPTVAMFEERFAVLEGAEAARATASGMAAVTAALLGQVRAGDRVVAARGLFGSCRWVVEDLLPRFGVNVELVPETDAAAWERAITPGTRTVFLESPVNPTLRCVDIALVARLAHAAGATLVVDNVFATPMLQSPLALGADCVIYSATKHVDGQGRCLGGIVLASRAFIDQHVHTFLRQTGPALSPFNAWVLLKGLETLALRVERQTATAGQLAAALSGHGKLAGLVYPGAPDHPDAAVIARQMRGGSTLIALDFAGGKEAAFRFMNALQLIRISNNLGDAKSLVTHPATTTHQRFAPAERAAMGIGEGLVRLSVGLEHADDLATDLLEALAAV